MNKIGFIFIAMGLVVLFGCSPGSGAILVPSPASANQTRVAGHLVVHTNKSSEAQVASSLDPQTILDKANLALSRLKSFRVRETLDPVAGSHATYEIETLLPDEEHVVSRGDCANKVRGESITMGTVRYQRCGVAAWIQTQQLSKGTLQTYQDYLENSHPFALLRLESENLWQIKADYPGGDSPPGTMIWLISQKDILPQKLTFLSLGGYGLTSEFRDFDDPSITVAAPGD